MNQQQVLDLLRANSAAMTAQSMDHRYTDTLAQDFVMEGDFLPAPVVGPAATVQTMNVFFAAFPDLRFEVERDFACGDQGAVCWRVTGTHQGDFAGIPPTGRRIEYHASGIFQVRAGKITQAWVYLDTGHILGNLVCCQVATRRRSLSSHALDLERQLAQLQAASL